MGSIFGSISVLDVPMNLRLKFHQNRVSNSWDIGNIEFMWVGWGGWYAKSFSCLTQLKIMLGWVVLWLSWGFDNTEILTTADSTLQIMLIYHFIQKLSPDKETMHTIPCNKFWLLSFQFNFFQKSMGKVVKIHLWKKLDFKS